MSSSVKTRTHTAVKSHPRPPTKAARVVKKKEPPVLKGRSTRWLAVWAAREEKFTEVFGPALPKGKVLAIDGECVAAKDVHETGWGLLQFPPRPGRMSWIYATHGLSQMPWPDGTGTTGVELILYWRHREKIPVRILAVAARALLSGKRAFESGEILSVAEAIEAPKCVFKHCVACLPDETIPGRITISGGTVIPLLLVGISDEEREYALKVNPEIANGRQVLLEALKTGGVYPVSDLGRQCLTRRRDFNRVWETAFRIVRERQAT